MINWPVRKAPRLVGSPRKSPRRQPQSLTGEGTSLPPTGHLKNLFLWFLIVSCMELSEACGPAEYYTGIECCPMCSPGHCVHRNCTEFTSTTCVPCLPLTFTDKPNGLMNCQPCMGCEAVAGLKVKRLCSSTSDTLCEPLEGYYCTDPIKDGCRGAVEHTKCSPGQYIKQTGTAFTDTVCGDCNNTYSDESFAFCRPHTRCESQGLFTRKAGTHTADAECEHRRHHLLLTPLAVVFIITILVLTGRCKYCQILSLKC